MQPRFQVTVECENRSGHGCLPSFGRDASRVPTVSEPQFVGKHREQLHSIFKFRKGPLDESVHDTAQDLSPPTFAMNRPSLNCPPLFPDDLWPARRADVSLTSYFGRFQLSADAPVVASPAVNGAVVHNGNDRRRGQIETKPGNHLVARGGIGFPKRQQIVVACRGIRSEPASWNKETISEKIGKRLARHRPNVGRFDPQLAQQICLEMLADFVGYRPLMAL